MTIGLGGQLDIEPSGTRVGWRVTGQPPASRSGSVLPEEVFRSRCQRFAAERDRLSQRRDRVANVRLLIFLAAALCLGLSVWQRSLVLGALALALLVGFLLLVRHHHRMDREWQRLNEMWRVNDEASMRQVRDWDGLPLRHTLRAEPEHSYARDLDILGWASLAHLLDTTGTSVGQSTLISWLSAPADPTTVRERQAAVAELAPLLDLRDELTVRGRLMGDPAPDPAPLLEWAEGPLWLSHKRALLWVSRVSPPLLWLGLLLQLTGLYRNSYWVILLGLNLCITFVVGGTAYRILSRVLSRGGALREYAELLELIHAQQLQAPMLVRLRASLDEGGIAAHHHVRRLHRLAALAVPPSALLNLPIQALLLWDIHVLAAVERWQAALGRRARGWMSVLGEAEALAALAALAHDNPDWTFPELNRDARAFDSRALGHPLLSREVRVTNDVSVGPAGTFLLVTGSNMSGKSTLLRAIGVNIVLASAGAPVCASMLRMPPVQLWTSMRVEDSLERGVSYFMAELRRLKAVVDAASSSPAGDHVLLYLLDEILQGTNTAERQIAARRILAYLLERGALGAVSTHDLALADTPALHSAAQPVHFTETIGVSTEGPSLTFDYKLRPGIATSTNALRLMEAVGLDLDNFGPLGE